MTDIHTDTVDKKHALRMRAATGIGMLAVLVILMMWLAGTFRSKIGPEVKTAVPVSRETTAGRRVEHRSYPLLIDQVGTVRSRTEAQVSARIMAQVKEIRVHEGDTIVGSGSEPQASPTVLAVLDDKEIQTKLGQAKSQITSLERAISAAGSKAEAADSQVLAAKAEAKMGDSDYKRFQSLNSQQAVTGRQFDQALMRKETAGAKLAAAIQESEASKREVSRLVAQKEQAEAALSEVRVILSYTVIQAPFSGKILKKMVDVGNMTTPGQALFHIETNAQPEMHATVSESLVAYLKIGQELDVAIDALGKTFAGRVIEIVPKSDPTTRTVIVKVSLPEDPRLVNGLFGRIRIPHGTYESLVIPAAAVRESGQLNLVDNVGPGGVVSRRFVTIGERHEDLVEVLSGLREGEEVKVGE